MKKIFKWVGIVLGVVVGLAVIAIVGLLIYGQMSFHAKVNRPLYEIKADTSPAGLARGEYLVRDLIACQGCHGPRVAEGELADRDAPLSGHTEDIVFGPIEAGFNTPNLTPDAETGLGSWTDAEIARAIREGVDKEGTVLAIMPSPEFRNLSDADVAAIIGYLRSMAPVYNEVPPVTVNAVGKAVLALGVFGPPNPAPQVSAPVPHPASPVEIGKYLAFACARCHGETMAGGPVPGAAEGDPPAANLTPGGELAGWSEEDFINTIRTGVNPAGRQLDDSMPWQELARWHDEDLSAVFKYLKSLPAAQSK